jgi:hypothetical protein
MDAAGAELVELSVDESASGFLISVISSMGTVASGTAPRRERLTDGAWSGTVES